MSGVIGVDIGQGSIKLVLIDKGSNGLLSLESIGETKIPLSVERNVNKAKYFGEVGDALKSLLTDLKIKNKQVVASLSENDVISRMVRLPPMKDSEIMDALRFEAETFVPYPLDEVSIDYEVIEKDDAGRLSVFVIAARNDLIQAYVKLFKSLGLELIAIESPSVSYRRVVKNSIKTVERVVILDLGEKYSDIFNINKGNAYFPDQFLLEENH